MEIAKSNFDGMKIDKINFGCGYNLLEGYLNVDADNIPLKPGYYFKQSKFLNPQEFPNDYFTEIKAQMVLEHIHPDIIPTVLYTMSCLLQVGGKVFVTVPNFAFFAEKINTIPKEIEKFTIRDLTVMRETMFQLLDPMMQDEGVSFRGHQSFWVPVMATYWFEGEGFCITDMIPSNPILTFTAIKKDKFSMAKNIGDGNYEL